MLLSYVLTLSSGKFCIFLVIDVPRYDVAILMCALSYFEWDFPLTDFYIAFAGM